MMLRIFQYTILLILVPTISLATPPYYGHNVAKKDVVIVKEKVVEFDEDFYLGLDGYYAIQDKAVAEHGVAAQIKKKDDQIDALIKLLEKKYNNGEKEDKPVETVPSLPPSEPTPKNDSLEGQVFQIFKKNCATCHGQNQASGKLKLIGRDEKGEYLVDIGLKSIRVYDRVLGSHLKERGLKLMPLNSDPLTDEDVQTIHLWNVQNIEKHISKTEAR